MSNKKSKEMKKKIFNQTLLGNMELKKVTMNNIKGGLTDDKKTVVDSYPSGCGVSGWGTKVCETCYVYSDGTSKCISVAVL